MNIVVAGHVDHGKSTIIGRLLSDTNSIPRDKLERVRRACDQNRRTFEYAFLVDALKSEQARGITIDSARVFFKTKKRQYTIIDVPGHVELLKNMVTGAARADAAFLVIDAKEGVHENSKRHGSMLSFLGTRQIIVLINKMENVDFKESVFEKIKKEYSLFLMRWGIQPHCFIPISGLCGDNIVFRTQKMPWYSGKTVLDALDSFDSPPSLVDQPFRMPVQDVYSLKDGGNIKKVVVGTVESGRLKEGDAVVFYPSGEKSRVKSIEIFPTTLKKEVSVGYAIGFTLENEVKVQRGEVVALAHEETPKVASSFNVVLLWLGEKPMQKQTQYLLKMGTAKISAVLEKITRLVNTSTLEDLKKTQMIPQNSVAECVLKLNKRVAFDQNECLLATNRFVLVDHYQICGGGRVRIKSNGYQSAGS